MNGFEYAAWDEELLKAFQGMADLMKLYNYLMTRLGADPEQVLKMMKDLQAQGYLPPEMDLEAFQKLLEEKGLVSSTPEGPRLTPKGERRLREAAFEEIFNKLRKAGTGDHRASRGSSEGDEVLPEKRRFEFGDDVRLIDFSDSLFNAVGRSGDFEMDLAEEDLEVYETDRATGCATVLLIDISHSMILYGEDRITPAKQVALAFAHLILTRYPKDDLSVVLFGDEATEVAVKDIPYIQVGPFHTNTQQGLRLAREILLKKRQVNRQIFMITDGKPSLITEPDGTLYKNSVGLDPRIVGKTLDEAAFCRRKNVTITTFMVTEDPYLQQFVERLTEINQGRAFFASLDDLGEFMMKSFIHGRKTR